MVGETISVGRTKGLLPRNRTRRIRSLYALELVPGILLGTPLRDAFKVLVGFQGSWVSPLFESRPIHSVCTLFTFLDLQFFHRKQNLRILEADPPQNAPYNIIIHTFLLRSFHSIHFTRSVTGQLVVVRKHVYQIPSRRNSVHLCRRLGRPSQATSSFI